MNPSIAIDATHYENEAPTGVEWYTRELLNHLVPLLISKGVSVSFIVHTQPKSVPDGVSVVVSPHVRLWRVRALPALIRSLSPTLYFTPSGIPPRNIPCKTACMVHDMAVYHSPQSFSLLDRFRLTTLSRDAARSAAIIFTPSQYTKNDVMSFWGIGAEKIVVTPHGLPDLGSEQEPIPGIDTSIPIIAYIGRIEHKKNIRMVIDAVSRVTTPCQLVLAGKLGFGGNDELRSAPKAVKYVGYVTNAQRNWLLHTASILVVPSQFEGFGVPVLEGFSAGVPVICSEAGALPEVGGDAVAYATDGSSWSTEITELLTNPEKTNALVRAGHLRKHEYSWDHTAELTAQTIISHLQ